MLHVTRLQTAFQILLGMLRLQESTPGTATHDTLAGQHHRHCCADGACKRTSQIRLGMVRLQESTPGTARHVAGQRRKHCWADDACRKALLALLSALRLQDSMTAQAALCNSLLATTAAPPTATRCCCSCYRCCCCRPHRAAVAFDGASSDVQAPHLGHQLKGEVSALPVL